MTWLLPTSTFSACAREPGCSTSASIWRAETLARSAMSRSKHMPARSWISAWKKAPWMQRLFGLICEPSTADHGVASWIASLAATRASPSVSPVLVEGLTTPATCGLILPALSVKSGLGGASSRTCPDTSRWDSMRLARIYSRWAIALRQEYSARPKPELPTEGSGCSSWPTARVATGAYTRDGGEKGKERPSLEGVAEMWPTPMAGTPAQNGNAMAGNNDFSRKTMEIAESASWASPRTSDTNGVGLHGDGGMDLRTQASMWGTPRASDGEKGGPNQSFGAGGTPLPAMAVEFQASARPTPATRDHKGSGPAEIRKDGKSRMCHLDFAAERGFPSPHPDQTTPAGPQSSSERRSLNPRFVEWLMGLPFGWTSCDCAETGFSLWQQRARGLLSTLCSPPSARQGSLF